MLKLEDFHSQPISGFGRFDFEHFVEGHLRNKTKEDDMRDFVYADTVLRPRHIVALYELVKPHESRLYSMLSPIIQFGGRELEAKSRRADSFIDLLTQLDDLIHNNSELFLFSVQRAVGVDPTGFNTVSGFKLRVGYP